MTKEKAIEILRSGPSGAIADYGLNEICEALTMAIEALKADRPMVIKCKPFLSEEDFKAFAEQVSEQNVILIPYEVEVISTDISADTVEVVRCEHCKWSDWYTVKHGYISVPLCYCTRTGKGGYTSNDYCSYGERREE